MDDETSHKRCYEPAAGTTAEEWDKEHEAFKLLGVNNVYAPGSKASIIKSRIDDIS